MARPKAHDKHAEVPVRMVRVTPATAARMLDIHYETVRDLITRGVFTVLAPNGRGPGRRVFLHTDEVERYGETCDELAVKQLRQDKGRLPVGRPKGRR